VRCDGLDGWHRRAAGHAENGSSSVNDPAMHGPALLESWRGGPSRDGQVDGASPGGHGIAVRPALGRIADDHLDHRAGIEPL
jgi:hypothetical protein